MNGYFQPAVRRSSTVLVAFFIVTSAALSAMPVEYPTLNSVKGVKAVFDVSHPSGN